MSDTTGVTSLGLRNDYRFGFNYNNGGTTDLRQQDYMSDGGDSFQNVVAPPPGKGDVSTGGVVPWLLTAKTGNNDDGYFGISLGVLGQYKAQNQGNNFYGVDGKISLAGSTPIMKLSGDTVWYVQGQASIAGTYDWQDNLKNSRLTIDSLGVYVDHLPLGMHSYYKAYANYNLTPGDTSAPISADLKSDFTLWHEAGLGIGRIDRYNQIPFIFDLGVRFGNTAVRNDDVDIVASFKTKDNSLKVTSDYRLNPGSEFNTFNLGAMYRFGKEDKGLFNIKDLFISAGAKWNNISDPYHQSVTPMIQIDYGDFHIFGEYTVGLGKGSDQLNPTQTSSVHGTYSGLPTQTGGTTQIFISFNGLTTNPMAVRSNNNVIIHVKTGGMKIIGPDGNPIQLYDKNSNPVDSLPVVLESLQAIDVASNPSGINLGEISTNYGNSYKGTVIPDGGIALGVPKPTQYSQYGLTNNNSGNVQYKLSGGFSTDAEDFSNNYFPGCTAQVSVDVWVERQ